jgi:hypothetical protein
MTAAEDGLHRRRTVMTDRDRLTITLRARSSGDDPVPGTLLASPKGRVVYRILEVWRVRRAGDHRYGFRLVCRRLSQAEVPEGGGGATVAVRPSCASREPPRGRSATTVRRSWPAGAAGSPHRASAPKHRSCLLSLLSRSAKPRQRRRQRNSPGRRLRLVQSSGAVGSPRVVGSTRAFRSASRVASVSVSFFRPPPGRRTRFTSISVAESNSAKPRSIVLRASPVIRDNANTPPRPAVRASAAAK